MTRQEHLNWCKERALKYIEMGYWDQAYASMCSDLSKHDDTQDHPAIALGMQLIIAGSLDTPDAMKQFIEGFN